MTTDLIEVDLRCTCSHRQTELLDGDASARAALASLRCQSCGNVGRLRMVPVLEHPPSVDLNDIA